MMWPRNKYQSHPYLSRSSQQWLTKKKLARLVRIRSAYVTVVTDACLTAVYVTVVGNAC